jgi:predicted phosphodiesterase
VKTIRHTLDCHDRPIEIVPLADLHLGDKEHNAELLNKWLDWLNGDDNRYCILAGDLMNSAIKTAISDTYTETLTPQEQLDKTIAIFGPFKDKILCVLSGNHEERISKLVGISPDRLFAAQMGLTHLYSDTSCILFLAFGDNKRRKGRKMVYSIYVNHGSGGGRKAGSKISRLADYGSIVDADVFVVGHTHFPASFKMGHFRTNTCNMSVAFHEQLYVNTASMLDYGGYGDRQGYQPASTSYPVITLDNCRHDIKVTL